MLTTALLDASNYVIHGVLRQAGLQRATGPGKMPSEPVSSFVIRPPGREPYVVTLDQLTALVRAARTLRMLTREELRLKRLQAMGVVGAQMQATADMYDRVIAAGDKVSEARTAAEAAHAAELEAQVADLKEMAGELQGFAQALPLSSKTAAPATVTPSNASAALATLNAAQPATLSKDAWAKGDAYEGTHPDVKSST